MRGTDMSSFTSYVSRKVLGVVAVFAVFAIAFAVVLVAQGGTDAVDLTATQVDDAQALDVALTDPAAINDVAAAPADPNGGWSQLRADLKAARALEGDARRTALADIRAKAQDGSYGIGIERRADRRQIHRELFFSLLPDNLQADLKELKDAPADQREQLRADILDKALAGDYGPDVQKAAQSLEELRKG
jgi:hypothetical protein